MKATNDTAIRATSNQSFFINAINKIPTLTIGIRKHDTDTKLANLEAEWTTYKNKQEKFSKDVTTLVLEIKKLIEDIEDENKKNKANDQGDPSSNLNKPSISGASNSDKDVLEKTTNDIKKIMIDIDEYIKSYNVQSQSIDSLIDNINNLSKYCSDHQNLTKNKKLLDIFKKIESIKNLIKDNSVINNQSIKTKNLLQSGSDFKKDEASDETDDDLSSIENDTLEDSHENDTLEDSHHDSTLVQSSTSKSDSD